MGTYIATIQLTPDMNTRKNTSKGKKHCFELYSLHSSNERVFYFCANSEEELESWINAIMGVIEQQVLKKKY